MDTMPVDAPRQAGLYVRRAREAQGLTRAQLARAAGVSERSLASLELGDATGIRLDKLLAVLGPLGLSLVVQGENIAGRGRVAASRDVRRARPEYWPAGAAGMQANGRPFDLQDLLTGHLAITTCHTYNCIRIMPDRSANHLTALTVTRIGYRTSINDINIRFIIKIDQGIAILLKQFLHCF